MNVKASITWQWEWQVYVIGGGKMKVEYRKVSDFERGTLFDLLKDSYSYDPRFQEHFS